MLAGDYRQELMMEVNVNDTVMGVAKYIKTISPGDEDINKRKRRE